MSSLRLALKLSMMPDEESKEEAAKLEKAHALEDLRKAATLEAMKEGGMASDKQIKELDKLKKLYPSMF